MNKCKRYFLPAVETKHYNVMINERKVFDQPVKNDLRTYDKIPKIATSPGGHYATACLLDYLYFKEHYESTAVDLNKQQPVDANPKTLPQINFGGNLDRAGNTTIFFVTDKAKKKKK